MKKTYTTIFLILIYLTVFSQGQNWQWAKKITTEHGFNACVSQTDQNGNVYVAGIFMGKTLQLGTAVLLNADTGGNSYDIFLVKYAPNGTLKWAKREGGIHTDFINNIAINASGNIVLTGGFSGSSTSIGTNVFFNQSNTSYLTVKFDTAGNVLWATAAGLGTFQMGASVGEDAAGNVYVAGVYTGYIKLGNIILADTNPQKNIFLVKYNTVGSVVWAKSIGGKIYPLAVPQILVLDSFCNINMSGSFSCPDLRFDSILLTNSSQSNIFNVKFDSSGKAIWANISKGGITYNSVALNYNTIDKKGNIYITGLFNSPTISFGNITLTKNDTIVSPTSYDGFLAKYDANGNIVWAKKISNSSSVYGYSLLCDKYDSLYLSGALPTTGNFMLGNTSFSGPGLFIIKYGPSGNLIWAKEVNGIATPNFMSADPQNNIFISGTFQSPVSFGNTTLSDTGSYGDIFVAKMSACSTPVPTITASGKLSFCVGSVVTLTSSDAYSYLWSDMQTTKSRIATATGDFTVTTSDTSGCTATSASVYVYVSNYPRAAIGQHHDTLYMYQTYPPHVTYQWYLNSVIIPGATGKTFIAKQNGNYTVNVIDTNGCSQLSLITIITNVGIDEAHGNNTSVLIYPNPNNGVFDVTTNTQTAITKIEVYDMIGNRLYEENLNTFSTQIHLAHLSKGIYFLKCFVGDKVVVKRVVIE